MMGTDDVKPKMNIFQKQFKEEDFDNKKNNNFFGGLFNKKSSRNHGLGKNAISGKVAPKSDDEGEIQRFELQQMLDMPDDLLRQNVELRDLQTKIERLDTNASNLEDLFYTELDEMCLQIENLED